MKSVLISIQPKWVEKIAKGEKTIEVRKTRPKIETPFKCYIYETQGEYKTGTGIFAYGIELKGTKKGKGKVIGEFVCDKIYKFAGRWFGDYTRPFGTEAMILRESCLTLDELTNYLSLKNGYAWHISDLKIYQKPKELSEFKAICNKVKHYETESKEFFDHCLNCEYLTETTRCLDSFECGKFITRPPQSWQYIESGVQCE